MRRYAVLALALALTGCAREPFLYESWDRVQLKQGQVCVVVTDNGKDAFFQQGTRLDFIPPTYRVAVLDDPIEKDLSKMTGREVRCRVLGGPMAERIGTIYRGNLKPED